VTRDLFESNPSDLPTPSTPDKGTNVPSGTNVPLWTNVPLGTNVPLAARMAPRDWGEFVGQGDLVAEGSLLRRAVDADRLGSALFFGPPGCGKTALARLVAAKTQSYVEQTNAVTIGVPDIRKMLAAAGERKRAVGRRTLLILDEIHHFNRTQQDALLPDVERGLVTLIGLTTENPFYYVNAALISRSTVYEFKPLAVDDLKGLVRRALADPDRGFGGIKVVLDPDAEAHILAMSDGDARRVLNALELAVMTTEEKGGVVHVTSAVAESSTQRRALRYDKSGDDHYDTISAFIKSLRGSDPDAALYWMAKMLAAGEDPRFVARRLLICASEDVGNADFRALVIANAAFEAVEKVGMPEARIPLAQAAVYIATAPKSNSSYVAINKALSEVERGKRREVPNHLKDASRDKDALGHGVGYKYPHDFLGHFTPQEYMPDWKRLWDPGEEGDEKRLKQNYKSLWPGRFS
jgi:putative ATPase